MLATCLLALGLVAANPTPALAGQCYWYWYEGTYYSYNHWTGTVDEHWYGYWYYWCENNYGHGEYSP